MKGGPVVEIAKTALSAAGQLANGDKIQKNETQADKKNGKLDFDAVLLSEIETGSHSTKGAAVFGSLATLPEMVPALPSAAASINDEPVLEEIQPGGVSGECNSDSGLDDLPRVSPETMVLLERCFGSLPMRDGVKEVGDTEGRKEQLLKGFLHLRKDLGALDPGGTGLPVEGEAEKPAENPEASEADISGVVLQARLVYGTSQEAASLVESSEQKAHATGALSGSSQAPAGSAIGMVNMENPVNRAAAKTASAELNITADDTKDVVRSAYAEPGGTFMDTKAAARLAYAEVSGTMTDMKPTAAEADRVSFIPRKTGESGKEVATAGKPGDISPDIVKMEPRPELPIAAREYVLPASGPRVGSVPATLKETEGLSGKKDEINPVNLQTPAVSSSPVSVPVDKEERASIELGEGLANFIEVVRNRKGHRGTLVLDPPDLGTVRITVESSREKVQVHLVVESAQTKNLVENSIGTLRDSMARQGLTLGETTVDVGGQGLEGGGSSGWSFRETGDPVPLAGSDQAVEIAEEEEIVARLDIERGLLHWIA